MATDVVVPEVGETGMDVTLVRWLKADGDPVAEGDILFELDTDKTVVEVEAWTAGTLVDLRVGPGDIVTPRQVIARILAPGEEAMAPGSITDTSSEPRASDPAAGDAPEVVASSPASGDSLDPDGGGASPRARRLARERGVDLATIAGTGADGLVTERDVLAALGESPEES